MDRLINYSTSTVVRLMTYGTLHALHEHALKRHQVTQLASVPPMRSASSGLNGLTDAAGNTASQTAELPAPNRTTKGPRIPPLPRMSHMFFFFPAPGPCKAKVHI